LNEPVAKSPAFPNQFTQPLVLAQDGLRYDDSTFPVVAKVVEAF